MRHGSSRNITRISRGGDAARMELKHPGNSGEIPARGLLFPHHWTRAMRLIACSSLETNWNKIEGAWHFSLVYLVSCGTTALWTSPSEHRKPSRRFGCLSHWTHIFVLFYCTYWKNFGPDCSVNHTARVSYVSIDCYKLCTFFLYLLYEIVPQIFTEFVTCSIESPFLNEVQTHKSYHLTK